MLNNEIQLTSKTLLSDFEIPFLDVTLTDRFLLPPKSLVKFGMTIPKTVGELCEASGMPLHEVCKILTECVELNLKVWTDFSIQHFIDSEEYWVVDMRPMVDMDSIPLHEDARIFHLGNPAAQLALMRNLTGVLVLSSEIEHAWSAAMGLREMGINAFVKKA